MHYVVIILLISFFIPVTIEIKMKTKDLKGIEEKDSIIVRVYKIKIYKHFFKEDIDSIINLEKLFEYIIRKALKIEKTYKMRIDLFKEIKIKYKKIKINYGINTNDYVLNTYINCLVMTFLNMLIGRNIDKMKNTDININFNNTKNEYSYYLECIFSVSIAKNIIVIGKYAFKYMRERWNLKCQNIQLKA